MLSDRSVPIGLIVNELVANSLNYAFEYRENGSIMVSLSAGAGGSRTVLVMSDSGQGFGPDKTSGSGLRLIRSLARQVAGHVEQETSPEGTSTRVTSIDGD